MTAVRVTSGVLVVVTVRVAVIVPVGPGVSVCAGTANSSPSLPEVEAVALLSEFVPSSITAGTLRVSSTIRETPNVRNGSRAPSLRIEEFCLFITQSPFDEVMT
jgi:hypothetical protein